MPGEEDSNQRNVGSSSASATFTNPPATQVTASKSSSAPLRSATTSTPVPNSSSSASAQSKCKTNHRHHKHRHRHKNDGGTCSTSSSTTSSEDEDRSKLELECQFAGIDIDPDIAELDLDEDDNNLDNGNGSGDVPVPPSPPQVPAKQIKTPPLSTQQTPVPLPVTTATTTNTTASGPTSRTESLRGSRSGRGASESGVGGLSVGLGPEDVEGATPTADDLLDDAANKTVECTEVIVPVQTLAQQCLFYTTAFFVLLAVFSLFTFLFLVPFVIDPAFMTIFMEFDPEPALCQTHANLKLVGKDSCNWTSCREGCTREIYTCTQITVKYHIANHHPSESVSGAGSSKRTPASSNSAGSGASGGGVSGSSSGTGGSKGKMTKPHAKSTSDHGSKHRTSSSGGGAGKGALNIKSGGDPFWHVKGAHLYPNVKGCGYPPIVNCTTWYGQYGAEGTNFSCFYSKVNPNMVVTTFDLEKVVMDLIFSMAIPIPAFIISIVYLIFAYFRIYGIESPSPDRRGTGVGSASGMAASSTNNNINGGEGSVGGGGSGSLEDNHSILSEEKTKILSGRREGSNGKKMPNSSGGKQIFEMNDLNPSLHPPDGDLLLPRRNNRAPERNGPNNPNAKNKGAGNIPGHHSSSSSPPSPPETLRYLEPGVLPERSNVLPPIQLPCQTQVSPSSTPLCDNKYAPSLDLLSDIMRLEEDEDDSYLNSAWADSASLKRSFHGLSNISWKP